MLTLKKKRRENLEQFLSGISTLMKYVSNIQSRKNELLLLLLIAAQISTCLHAPKMCQDKLKMKLRSRLCYCW